MERAGNEITTVTVRVNNPQRRIRNQYTRNYKQQIQPNGKKRLFKQNRDCPHSCNTRQHCQKQPQAPFQQIQDWQSFCYSHCLCRNHTGDYEYHEKYHHFHEQVKCQHTELGNRKRISADRQRQHF